MTRVERYRARARARRRRFRIALSGTVGLAVVLGLGAWLLSPTALPAKTVSPDSTAVARDTPDATPTTMRAAPGTGPPSARPDPAEPSATNGPEPASPFVSPEPPTTPAPSVPEAEAPAASRPATPAAPPEAKENTAETRLPIIAGVVERARQALGLTGAFVAADVLGYIAFNDNDTDIGQRVEELVPHVDYLCPMVYPPGITWGFRGTRKPVANPYRVVHESVRLIRQRSADTGPRVRPWLQDFRDYAFDKGVFGPAEVRAQIKGAQDAGAAGWMLWNPRNDYTGRALAPERSLAGR